MKTSGLRRLYSILLLIVFMLPGIISVTVIFASHFNAPIATEVFLEIENESGKKGSEETNVSFSEYYTDHSTDYLLSPSIDFNKKSNILADINYKDSIFLSIPTPPPDFFMV